MGKAFIFAAALILGYQNLPAYAGGESSAGGADDYQVVPAFFLDYLNQKPVTACLEISPNFHVNTSTLEDMVRRAFEEWRLYIIHKRLNIVPGRKRIRATLDLRPNCKGDENLTFYFGIENDQVKKYRTQFSKPFGFAQLVFQANLYNEESRGFIWIAPPGYVDAAKGIPSWSHESEDSLWGLILHEVGHVFGNGHVDGTVMSDRIGKYLENDTTPGQTSRNVELYSKIDSQVELVPCMECHMAYSPAETFDPIPPEGSSSASDWIRTFILLSGRAPQSPMVIRFERSGSPQGSGVLTLMDSLGTLLFPVNAITVIGQHTDATPLFSGHGDSNFNSFGISYFGKIKTAAGQVIEVAVNYNMDERKAQILPLGEEFYPRPLFVSAD